MEFSESVYRIDEILEVNENNVREWIVCTQENTFATISLETFDKYVKNGFPETYINKAFGSGGAGQKLKSILFGMAKTDANGEVSKKKLAETLEKNKKDSKTCLNILSGVLKAYGVSKTVNTYDKILSKYEPQLLAEYPDNETVKKLLDYMNEQVANSAVDIILEMTYPFANEAVKNGVDEVWNSAEGYDELKNIFVEYYLSRGSATVMFYGIFFADMESWGSMWMNTKTIRTDFFFDVLPKYFSGDTNISYTDKRLAGIDELNHELESELSCLLELGRYFELAFADE